jgi:gluconolactonase
MHPLSALLLLAAGDAPRLPETVAPDAGLVIEYQDDRFFEGPTWHPGIGKLLFTAFGKDTTQILRLDGGGKAAVWLDRTEGVNGTYLAKSGRLLGAQAYGHRVMSYAVGPDGPTDTKVLYENKALNQPNDLCEAPNGDVYFTDPDFKDRKTSGVWLLRPDSKATKLIDDLPLPNGIKTSRDGKTLYVSDSHLHRWKAYPVRADGTLGEGRVFFNPDTPNKDEPDGMAVDEKGNLYFTGRGGVWVVTPEGKCLGLIPVPEFCSNVTFGGQDGRTLYLTCSKKVYSLKMSVRGALFTK